MPDLDMSEVLTDPAFTETISVIRRPIVMVKGRSTSPDPVRTDDVIAIVNSGVSELDRAADQQNMPNRISVHTQFFLQGPAKSGAPQFQPDIVVYRGDNYVVASLDDYSKYGPGFVHAYCDSMASIDSPPAGQ